MMALPAVRAVMSSPSRIGTPEDSSVDSVRQNRATATLRRMLPRIGIFSSDARRSCGARRRSRSSA